MSYIPDAVSCYNGGESGHEHRPSPHPHHGSFT